MSFVPSELTLTEPTLGNVFNIIATDKGAVMQTLANTDNIIISTLDADPLNTITLDAPITKLRTDTLYIEGKTSGSSYTLPTVQPTDNSVIEFMANGTSQFVPNGGGGGAVNAVLNTAYPTTANAGSILVMNGGDAISSSPSPVQIVSNPNIALLSLTNTNDPNLGATLSYSINDGALILENVDNAIVRDNLIRIDQNISLDTTSSNIAGDIELKASGNIKLTGGVNITGGDNTNNIYKNGGNELKLNGENNVYLNSSAGSTFIQSSGGNINIDAPSGVISLACIGDINLTPTYGSTKINNNTMLKFPDGSTATEAQLRQNTQGIFTLTNNGGMLLTTGGGAGLTLTETDTNLTMNIGNGKGNGYIQTSNDTQSLDLSTSLTDPTNTIVIRSPNINIEEGDVSIIKVQPKLNFNHTDYPTQQCNIRFQTNTEELIMEHFTPDNAARTQVRLGINDINLETLVGLQPGDIKLRTGGSGQTYINDYKLPNINPTADGQLLSCNIDGGSSWISATLPPGLLRAINCNLITPTEIVDVVWSNLSPVEQLAWKGGDPAIIDPVQSATGNYWNFTKAAPSTNKIGWTIPDDLSALSFQDLQSFWVVIRFNNTTNISTEGALYLSIQTNPPTGLNTFRTRWNYSNPATAVNQTGYFYKLYALDTITTTTAANFGKGQEVGQTQFKNNPCNVSPELWSIALNKQVLSPSGNTTAGYTTAPIQSISLQTASNIHTFNFDVVSIGYLNKQYNLQFA